jgi:hypothetical protein
MRSSLYSKRDGLRTHFALDLVNVIGTQHDTLSNAGISCVDLNDLWWSESELKSFQSSTTLLKKEIMKHAKVNTHRSYGDILINTFISCDCVDGQTLERRHYLREWTRNAPSRRGIENRIVSELALLRNDSKRNTIEAVLKAQECCSNLGQDMRSEFIRSISEGRSLAARNFALMMGDGDAYAEGFQTVTRRSSSMVTPRLLHHDRKGGEKNLILNLVKRIKRIKRVST